MDMSLESPTTAVVIGAGTGGLAAARAVVIVEAQHLLEPRRAVREPALVARLMNAAATS